MKRPQTSTVPRFAVTNVSASSANISNLQVAAVIYAFDVPLHKSRPYDIQAGDGIKGNVVIWHFDQQDLAGNSPKQIAAKYLDDQWIALNPSNPLAVCRRAFDEFAKLKRYLNTGGIKTHTGAACRVTNTRKAAVLLALGHPLLGWQRNAQVTTWCFHEAAAADAALYDSPDLYETLPDAAISYAKGAILGHEQMVALAKQATTARVQHKGRTALIGRDIDKSKQDTIEKLLFRK